MLDGVCTHDRRRQLLVHHEHGETVDQRPEHEAQLLGITGADPARALAFAALTPANMGQSVRVVTGTQLASVTVPRGQVSRAVGRLRRSGAVTSVQRDVRFEPQESIPNDPFFPSVGKGRKYNLNMTRSSLDNISEFDCVVINPAHPLNPPQFVNILSKARRQREEAGAVTPIGTSIPSLSPVPHHTISQASRHKGGTSQDIRNPGSALNFQGFLRIAHSRPSPSEAVQ